MNLRFSDGAVRVRLSQQDVAHVLEKGSIDCVTRFPNGKRFRSGLRIARIPEGEMAPPLVLSFTTEGGGFGADLVIVVADRELQKLIGAGKDAQITEQMPTPEGAPLQVVVEIDAFKSKKLKD